MNNDFHKTHDIFDLFKDLTVKGLDKEATGIVEPESQPANGASEPHQNGDAAPMKESN